jgi:hypothetical protein
MINKTNFRTTFVCFCLFISGNVFAQFPNLKELADKLKQSGQSRSPENTPPAPQTAPALEQRPASSPQIQPDQASPQTTSNNIGELKDGKRNGQGSVTLPNGIKYIGEFKDDKFHGQGTLTFPSGNKYVGEFKEGKLHGQGTFTWTVGEKYVGEYKEGKRDGKATTTYPNGSKYVGEYKDDKLNGQGTLTTADGKVTSGQWLDGKLVEPKEQNSVAVFRERFCKSIDETVSPPPNFSYKDIRTGDICKFPDEVLLEIIKFSATAKHSLVTHPGGAFTLSSGPHQGRLISGDYKFHQLVVLVNQFTSKVYVPSMALIVCREDSSNSMDEGSTFRKALDQKFGKPSSSGTEYDEMQQNAKAMEADIAERKKKVITIKDAKDVQNLENQLNMYRNTIIANTDRKKLKYVNYDYDPKNPSPSMQITQPNMNFVELRDHKCKPEDNGSVFQFMFGPSNTLKKVLITYDEQVARAQNDQKQKAPTPKF